MQEVVQMLDVMPVGKCRSNYLLILHIFLSFYCRFLSRWWGGVRFFIWRDHYRKHPASMDVDLQRCHLFTQRFSDIGGIIPSFMGLEWARRSWKTGDITVYLSSQTLYSSYLIKIWCCSERLEGAFSSSVLLSWVSGSEVTTSNLLEPFMDASPSASTINHSRGWGLAVVSPLCSGKCSISPHPFGCSLGPQRWSTLWKQPNCVYFWWNCWSSFGSPCLFYDKIRAPAPTFPLPMGLWWICDEHCLVLPHCQWARSSFGCPGCDSGSWCSDFGINCPGMGQFDWRFDVKSCTCFQWCRWCTDCNYRLLCWPHVQHLGWPGSVFSTCNLEFLSFGVWHPNRHQLVLHHWVSIYWFTLGTCCLAFQRNEAKQGLQHWALASVHKLSFVAAGQLHRSHLTTWSWWSNIWTATSDKIIFLKTATLRITMGCCRFPSHESVNVL